MATIIQLPLQFKENSIKWVPAECKANLRGTQGLVALILVFWSNLHCSCANSWGSGTILSWALNVSQDYSIINRVLLSSESQSIGWNLDRVGSQRRPSHILLDRHQIKLICCIWNEIMNGKVAFRTAERVQWYLWESTLKETHSKYKALSWWLPWVAN